MKPVLLAVVSDTHANSTVGLCPAEGVQLDDGGYYKPSKAQLWMWEKWLHFWAQAQARRVAEKAKLVVVLNGDCVDGDHHGTPAIISRNMEVQGYVASRVFSVPKDLKPDAMYLVRGTETHVGPSASSEEALAKSLGCERDPETQNWSVWRLRLQVHGHLIDFQHHGRFGQRPWTKQNALNLLAMQIYMEHSLAGERHPDLAFRSHLHQYGDSFGGCPTRVIQTPAWQLKTAYAHRVAAESIADVGGMLCLLRPEEGPLMVPVLYKPSLPQPRKVA